jgi:hypothetical protein
VRLPAIPQAFVGECAEVLHRFLHVLGQAFELSWLHCDALRQGRHLRRQRANGVRDLFVTALASAVLRRRSTD